MSMKTSKASRLAGFTLVEIMIVVAIIGVLAAIGIPSFLHARTRSQATACINNLRQIESAVQQVAIEKGKHVGDTIQLSRRNYCLHQIEFRRVNPSLPGRSATTALRLWGQSRKRFVHSAQRLTLRMSCSNNWPYLLKAQGTPLCLLFWIRRRLTSRTFG